MFDCFKNLGKLNTITMSTFKQIYLAYILICMVCHFFSLAMSYRRASRMKSSN